MFVLIVDDERVARARIRALLAARAEVTRIEECADGADAVAAIRKRRPDLVFLDVQMPELDGFQVIRAIGADRMPPVVFVTAFDQYALRAFEVEALDYLLKPFDEDRFAAAFDRARRRATVASASDLGRRLQTLLDRLGPVEPLDRIVVSGRRGRTVVRAAEVDWLEADDNYVKLHVGSACHLVRSKLSALEARLDPRRFARVHRSAIVNLDRVAEIVPGEHGDVLVLRSGARVPLSQSRREAVLGRLGPGL